MAGEYGTATQDVASRLGKAAADVLSDLLPFLASWVFWAGAVGLAVLLAVGQAVSPRFRHACRLWAARFLGHAHVQRALAYLAEEQVPVEVDLAGSGRHLCSCLVHAVGRGAVRLEVLQNRGLTPSLAGREVLCHFRPLQHVHVKANAFRTYILGLEKAAADITILVLRMPASTQNIQRRRLERTRIRNLRTAMARVWIKTPDTKRDWHLKIGESAFQVGEAGPDDQPHPDERVVDLSPGGMRLIVPRAAVRGDIAFGREVNLELRVFDPGTKGFECFFFGGVVRHLTPTRHRQLIMGLEFTSVGVRRSQGDLDFSGAQKTPVLNAFKQVLARLEEKQG